MGTKTFITVNSNALGVRVAVLKVFEGLEAALNLKSVEVQPHGKHVSGTETIVPRMKCYGGLTLSPF